MTEMMRSEDSFLERKRCSLPRASPGWRPSDEKSCGSVGGQLLTLYDVPDPQLSYCCLNTTSDGELTTSRAATSNAGRVGCGKVSPVLGQICSVDCALPSEDVQITDPLLSGVILPFC